MQRPSNADELLEPITRVGLPRLVRLGVLTALPPTWYEIAVLHFRGSFQSRPMWLPVAALPAVMLVGAASVIDADERRSRRMFRPLALLTLALGLGGTLFHFRGVARQMGGLRNLRYNATTGPPVQAPAQVALFGLLGALASLPPSRGEDERLADWARAVNIGSYLLLLWEAGSSHWMGGFFNRVMYVPVVLSPTLIATHVAAGSRRSRAGRSAEAGLSAVAVVAGLIGFGFHFRNVMWRGGFTWQNLFYGAPIVAPLQLTAQGTLGVLTAFFDRRTR